MNKFNNFLAVIIVTCFFIIAGCSQPGSTDNPVPPGPTAAPTAAPVGPGVVNLGSADFFTILAESGITTTLVPPAPASAIEGNIGVSPFTYTAITGFALNPVVPNANTMFAFSPLLTNGLVYAADYIGGGASTPAMLTAAVIDKNLAHVDAMGRTATLANTDLGASGDIGGMTFAPGLYKWNTNVTMSSDITLSGNVNDTWIFQISGTFAIASATSVILTGGAQAQNITWATTMTVSLGSTAHFEGIVLSATDITLIAGSSVKGRLYAGTNVTLISNTIVTLP